MVMQTLPMERKGNSSFDIIIPFLPFLRYIHLFYMESRETKLHDLRCGETSQGNPHVCYFAKMMMSDRSLDNRTLERLPSLYTNDLECTGTTLI